jgi:ribonuclease-3 family protein
MGYLGASGQTERLEEIISWIYKQVESGRTANHGTTK